MKELVWRGFYCRAACSLKQSIHTLVLGQLRGCTLQDVSLVEGLCENSAKSSIWLLFLFACFVCLFVCCCFLFRPQICVNSNSNYKEHDHYHRSKCDGFFLFSMLCRTVLGNVFCLCFSSACQSLNGARRVAASSPYCCRGNRPETTELMTGIDCGIERVHACIWAKDKVWDMLKEHDHTVLTSHHEYAYMCNYVMMEKLWWMCMISGETAKDCYLWNHVEIDVIWSWWKCDSDSEWSLSWSLKNGMAVLHYPW